MKKKLKIFKGSLNNAPYLVWLDSIKNWVVRSRIERRVDRLKIGHYGDYKSIAKNLFELRFHFGSGYRVYFTEVNNKIIVLLAGGDKTSQHKDIQLAKKCLNLLLEAIDEKEIERVFD